MSNYEPLLERTVLENRYRIRKLLAQGGMGAVYSAIDTRLDKPVAIKENLVQIRSGVDREASIDQFKREATILSDLSHPHLPRVTDQFIDGERQYLVMDFVEGQNLWERIEDRSQPLEESQALEIIIQICDVVTYLHSQDPPVIHRDIKPQNIKITPDGRAMLVDFGLAKMGGADVQTRSGAMAWTPGFSPPEQHTSTERTMPASDIYALGATLYALLTAIEPPVSTRIMTGVATLELPEILNPKLSNRVSRAIAHAMEIRIPDRPATVAEWQAELEALLQNLDEEVERSLAERAEDQRRAAEKADLWQESILQKSSSPFVYDKPIPPTQFVGREGLIRDCQDYLTQAYRTNIAISGDHGLGKTSLLQYLVHLAEKENWSGGETESIFIYVDCQAIKPFTSTNFWRQILNSLKQANNHPPIVQRADRLLSQAAIDLLHIHRLFSWLHDQRFSIILLLDDFSAIVKNNTANKETIISFLSNLNALTNLPDQAPGLVIASRQDLDNLCYDIVREHPEAFFYRNAIFRSLTPFAPKEMNVLFEQALSNVNIAFNQANFSFLYRVAGAHPAFLQMAGHHLYKAHILKLSADEIYIKATEDFEQSAQPYFSLFWEESAPQDRVLLLLIILKNLLTQTAVQANKTNFQSLLQKYERNLRNLVKRALVQKLENNYQIVSSVFAWWIVDKTITESQEGLTDQYQAIKDNALSKVWRIFRQLDAHLSFDNRTQNIVIDAVGLNMAQTMLSEYFSSEKFSTEIVAQPQETAKLIPERYDVRSELGRGGSGVVYKAFDTALKRLAAIKSLHDHLDTGSSDSFSNLLREAQASSNLRHPNIITIYDILEVKGQIFLIMEYLEGQSLADLISQEGRLPLARVVSLMEQAAAALDYAHSQKVLHRDIKPGNFIIHKDELKLTDFGIAKTIGDENTTYGIKGTIRYMSPEQVNQDPLDERSDLFALAVVAFEMLTGDSPWEGSTFLELMNNISNSEPDLLTHFDLSVTPTLEPIFQKALAKNPDERYQSGKDFVEALRKASMQNITP